MTRKTGAFGAMAVLMLGACSTEIVGYRAPLHGDDAAVEPIDLGVEPVDVGTPVADVPAAPDVPDVPPPPPPPPCVTGVRWTMGNEGDRMMNPGQACVACHLREREGPTLIGGTAYAQPLQEDNCFGVRGTGSTATGSAYVEATDAAGLTFRMAINQAGNFYYDSRTRIAFPLRNIAVVAPSGQRNAMDGEAPHGDCNGCHTREGTTTVAGGDPAPGRILLTP
ncbi:MAG: hypothetical protein EPO40_14030 [Myxococcaceae bacterium]|nr:MAG: hypothetical protein EPO40_14030 [Myxococcaceae bacterium]